HSIFSRESPRDDPLRLEGYFDGGERFFKPLETSLRFDAALGSAHHRDASSPMHLGQVSHEAPGAPDVVDGDARDSRNLDADRHSRDAHEAPQETLQFADARLIAQGAGEDDKPVDRSFFEHV